MTHVFICPHFGVAGMPSLSGSSTKVQIPGKPAPGATYVLSAAFLTSLNGREASTAAAAARPTDTPGFVSSNPQAASDGASLASHPCEGKS